MVKRRKQSYFNDYLNGADVKTFWKAVRLLNSNTSSIPTLTDGNHTAETSMAKAITLNNFFYTCFNKDQPPLSSSQTEFTYDSLHPNDCPIQLLGRTVDGTRYIQVYWYKTSLAQCNRYDDERCQRKRKTQLDYPAKI